MMSLPLFARPNSLIALGANDQRPDYDYADGVTLHLFALDDGATAEAIIPTLDGTPALTVRATRRSNTITFRADGQTAHWQVLLRGIPEVRQVTGGETHTAPLGALVQAAPGATEVVVTL